MSIDHPLLRKHADKVAGVLSCFDRVILRGRLPLSYSRGVEGFLYQQRVPLKEFKDYAPQAAERIKAHVKGVVLAAGAPFRHLPGREPMEEHARRMAAEKGIRAGIVGGFSQLAEAEQQRINTLVLARTITQTETCHNRLLSTSLDPRYRH